MRRRRDGFEWYFRSNGQGIESSRHGGRANYLFADLHVATAKSDEARRGVRDPGSQ